MTMKLFDALGFSWDRSAIPETVPVHSVERVCFRFHRMLPDFVWDASVLEGNPLTFPEIKTLVDGITVGGRKISDETQVLNLIESSRHLLSLVKSKRLDLSKETFTALHSMIARTDARTDARTEALEWGVFRGEGQEHNYTPNVGLGKYGVYTPPETQLHSVTLNGIFHGGLAELFRCSPLERGMAFFLFGALQQFFFDGNKRTSRIMMNGILMSNGIDAISVPAAKAQEYNEKMVNFYMNRNADEMMSFLVDCHPDGQKMKDDLHSTRIERYKSMRSAP